MPREEMTSHDFSGLGIAPGFLKRLKEMNFAHPTPIQLKAIPVATAGEDVVGIAQTGSGKTLAFSIPMLMHVSATKQKGLVLLPTRELAVQVEETLKKIAGFAGLRTAIIIGGASARPQIQALRGKPHVIVATPGRLIDLMEQKHVHLSDIGILVLDEADRMLDMGFAPQLNKIMAELPADRQTMLFSATMPDAIAKIAREFMKKPVRVEVARPGTTADQIDQEVYIVPRSDKMPLLERLLAEYKGSVLIFSRTKHGAKKIAFSVRQMGHSATEIHSNRSQNQRQMALRGFSSGKYRVMVATDIAARGIDVENIELVINFDLPDQIDDYVHRIGRTGRAGRSGKAISFAAPEQKRDVAQIQQLINTTLPIKSPQGEDLDPIAKATGRDSGGGGRKFGGGGGRSRGRSGGSGGGRRFGSGGGGSSRRPGGYGRGGNTSAGPSARSGSRPKR